MLDLKNKYLKMIQAVLSEKIPNMEVWAYGSRVNGKAHEGSDLDLVVINPKNPSLPLEKMGVLQEAFRVSNIPIIIDIHDWAVLPSHFQEEIKKNHFVIGSK